MAKKNNEKLALACECLIEYTRGRLDALEELVADPLICSAKVELNSILSKYEELVERLGVYE